MWSEAHTCATCSALHNMLTCMPACASRRVLGALLSPPPPPAAWPQVDNRLGTFIAVRSFSAPPGDVPRTVKMIEERAAARPAAAARQIPA